MNILELHATSDRLITCTVARYLMPSDSETHNPAAKF